MADLIINSNSTNYFSATPVDNNFFSLNPNGTYNLVTDGETSNLWTVRIDRKDTMDDIMIFSIDGLPASAMITTSVIGYNESNNVVFNQTVSNNGACQVRMYMTAFIVVNITQNMPLREVNCNELKISLSSEGVPWESAFMTGNEIATVSQFKTFVDSNQLQTDTMINFCAYMGIPYVPEIIAGTGIEILENRTSVNGNEVNIDVDIEISGFTGGTLFTLPTSIAPTNTVESYNRAFRVTGESLPMYVYTTITINTDGSVNSSGFKNNMGVAVTDRTITISYSYSIAQSKEVSSWL